MVNIIDLDIGNIRSISNMLSRLGVSSETISEPSLINSRTLILPGVGSASLFMQKIRARHFDKAIHDHIRNGNRLIGICLGFQVLTEFSEEDGGTKCLGLIETNTIHLSKHSNLFNHNHWEDFFIRKQDLSLSEETGFKSRSRLSVVRGRVFYNHEYGVKIPSDNQCFTQINSTELASFASIYSKDNIIGIQFHPEKSQATGHQLFSLFF